MQDYIYNNRSAGPLWNVSEDEPRSHNRIIQNKKTERQARFEAIEQRGQRIIAKSVYVRRCFPSAESAMFRANNPSKSGKLRTKKSRQKTGLENQAVGRVSNPHQGEYPPRYFQKLLVRCFSIV